MLEAALMERRRQKVVGFNGGLKEGKPEVVREVMARRGCRDPGQLPIEKVLHAIAMLPWE